MLWLVLKEFNSSHQIIGCNLAQNGDVHQLWITRPGNKGLLIKEENDFNTIKEYKEAIDFAVEKGETVVEI